MRTAERVRVYERTAERPDDRPGVSPAAVCLVFAVFALRVDLMRILIPKSPYAV